MPAGAMPLDPQVFRAVVEHVAEALVYADRDGVIRIWNAGAESLFGFAADEAVGASLDLIIPERLRAAHWNGYRQALERGRTRLGGQVRMTRALHKDGRRLYVDMSFAVVTLPDGTVAGSVAMARDATARQAAEAAARDAAARDAAAPASGLADASTRPGKPA